MLPKESSKKIGLMLLKESSKKIGLWRTYKFESTKICKTWITKYLHKGKKKSYRDIYFGSFFGVILHYSIIVHRKNNLS